MAEAPVAPVHYRLQLDPRPDAGTFNGEVAITLAVAQATPQVRLDCVDLEIDEVTLDGAPAAWHIEQQTLVIGSQSPQSPLQPGRAVVAIRYRGHLDASALRGLHRTGEMLATWLQPTHARRVFPCFDEPRFRSVFELSVWVAQGQTAISNAAVFDAPLSAGRRLVRFAPSPAIPTYLLALAIGAFETLADSRHDPPIAVHALHAPERCAFALRIARDALEFQSAWLARPYAFDKLDLVVLPRTGVAGMENTAAIFLRESVVAIDERASVQTRADAAALIAHEVAHQWFGGLVTPQGWHELWLNEGFATWMAAKTLSNTAPSLAQDADDVRAIRAALHRDFGAGARALVTGGETPSDIEELFDATAYRKGAALLRMLEAWLGEQAFQRGLRLYLDRHAGATATSEDLWRALEEACDKPVAEVGRSFAARAGAPHLAIRWEGNTVEVTQIGEELWSVPVRLRVALDGGEEIGEDIREQVVSLFLEGPFARVTLPSRISWAMGDAGAVGYYRCSYPAARPPIARVSACEAVVLIEDAWLALWSDEIDLVSYLGTMGEAIAAGAAISSVRAHAQELRDLLASGGRAALFDRWIASICPAGLEEEIRSARPDGAELFDVLRAALDVEPDSERLIMALCAFEDAACLDKQLALLDAQVLDEPARVRVAEDLLANPATRHACWARIKQRWDDSGARLVGLGGRGVIAGLAAFSDPASESDIADFFARHDVPGAKRMLRSTLALIAVRRQFRERHQAAMDAFLIRRDAPAGELAERVRIEHTLLAAMAAGFRGALAQRNLHERFGLPAPPWMHTLENLRGAAASSERQLASVHRGASVLSQGDVQLAHRLREDLHAAADQLEGLVRKCKDAGREVFFAVAAGFARCAATVERELDARVVFCALFGPPQCADALRKEFADAKAAFAPAHRWITQAPNAPDSLQRLALQNHAMLAPGMLRLHANRIQEQLAALGMATPVDPFAAWSAFGFDARTADTWRAAGFDDGQRAAEWRLRGFDPKTARRHRDQGADAAALRERPAMSSAKATHRIVLPDGTAFTVEVARDAVTRTQGLMHRDALPARGGMLFVYPDERPRPITMRNVRMPLDVIWLRDDGTVAHIERDVQPWRDAPVPQDPQQARCRFVLELPAGAAQRHGIEVAAALALGSPSLQWVQI